MSGSGLLHTISFIAVVIVVLLTVWIVLVLESGGHRPARRQEEAKLSDEPGHTTAQPRALRSPSPPSRGQGQGQGFSLVRRRARSVIVGK